MHMMQFRQSKQQQQIHACVCTRRPTDTRTHSSSPSSSSSFSSPHVSFNDQPFPLSLLSSAAAHACSAIYYWSQGCRWVGRSERANDEQHCSSIPCCNCNSNSNSNSMMDDDYASSTSSSSSSTSFVVLSVSIAGILATALLLLSYYLFITRCGLLFFWRSSRSQTIVAAAAQAPPPSHARGLQGAAIRRLPTFRYQLGSTRSSSSIKKQQSDCAVCLADFRDGERLRLLPPCRHAFHIDCIDAWLQATANCPLCRATIIPEDDRLTACGHDYDTTVIDISAAAASDEANSPAIQVPAPTRSRRSLSMDSSTVYLALHRMMLHHQHQDHQQQREDAKSPRASASPRSRTSLRRSFFSFSHSRSATVLPL